MSRSLLVELKEPAEYLLVIERIGPTVGCKNGTIQAVMCLGEPARALVVEVSQRSSLEPSRAESRRVQPSLTERIQRLSSNGNGSGLLLVHWLREREGFKRGCRRVAKATLNLAQLSTHSTCPQFMNPGMQHTEEEVVLTSKGYEGIMRQRFGAEPSKQAILGRRRRHNVSP